MAFLQSRDPDGIPRVPSGMQIPYGNPNGNPNGISSGYRTRDLHVSSRARLHVSTTADKFKEFQLSSVRGRSRWQTRPIRMCFSFWDFPPVPSTGLITTGREKLASSWCSLGSSYRWRSMESYDFGQREKSFQEKICQKKVLV